MGEALSALVIQPVCEPICKCCDNCVKYGINGSTNECDMCGVHCKNQNPVIHASDVEVDEPDTPKQMLEIINRIENIEDSIGSLRTKVKHYHKQKSVLSDQSIPKDKSQNIL